MIGFDSALLQLAPPNDEEVRRVEGDRAKGIIHVIYPRQILIVAEV